MRPALWPRLLTACLLASLASPALADNYPIAFKGRLMALDHLGYLYPLRYTTVLIFEDDFSDDDFVDAIETDHDGYFWTRTYQVDDTDGLTDPEYNLLLSFQTRLRVPFSPDHATASIGSLNGFDPKFIEVYELAHSIDPEDHLQLPGNALYDLGEVVMAQNETVRRWGSLLLEATEHIERLWLNVHIY